MLIFGLPPSHPAPEFEPGLNLGSNPPPPYLAPDLVKLDILLADLSPPVSSFFRHRTAEQV